MVIDSDSFLSSPVVSSTAAVTNTNRKVKMWSFIECLAVMGVSGLQVLFIKRMFSKHTPGIKRMV